MRWKVGWYDLKSNGIRIYYFYDSGGTTHICGIGYRIGSAHDPVMAKGIAHYVEHLVSRVSTLHDGDEIYRILWRYLGGPEDWKIETDQTSTYYGGGGLYYRKYMPEVMAMFTALLKDRLISAEGLKIEHAAVLNEIALTQEDNPIDKLNLVFHQTMYETNPIRSSILGTEADLSQITTSRARQFLKKFYVAENMFSVIFGPSRQDSIRFAEEYLNDWPYRGSAANLNFESFDVLPVITKPRIAECFKNGLACNYVQLGFPTKPYVTKDDAVLDVISDILWMRMTEALREKNQDSQKGVYRSPGFTERSLVHGVIGGWFATTSKDYAFYGRDQILKEFLRLREELVPKSVVDCFVESAKERFLSKFRDSPEEVANLVIESASNGDPDLSHLHSYAERLAKIKPSKIRDIANKYFNTDGYACVIMMPS